VKGRTAPFAARRDASGARSFELQTLLGQVSACCAKPRVCMLREEASCVRRAVWRSADAHVKGNALGRCGTDDCCGFRSL